MADIVIYFNGKRLPEPVFSVNTRGRLAPEGREALTLLPVSPLQRYHYGDRWETYERWITEYGEVTEWYRVEEDEEGNPVLIDMLAKEVSP